IRAQGIRMNVQPQEPPWHRLLLSAAAALVIVGSALFLILTATWRLDSPGLYYDETLFFPAAARIFGNCNVWAWVYWQIGCVPLILHPAYIGGLKSDLFGVWFAFLEPGIVAVRAPMIALHGINIALMVAFWRSRLGPWLSLALLVMLCVDVAATFHARLD